MNLKNKAKKLRKNKANTKWLIVEIMKLSTIDFDVEHTCYKLRQYGFGTISEGSVYRWMIELSEENILIFNGWKPEFVESLKVGEKPTFGLINHPKRAKA